MATDFLPCTTTPSAIGAWLYRVVLWAGLGLVGAFSSAGIASADGAQRDSNARAAFLLRLGGFVEWPKQAPNAPGQAFVIGVVGDDDATRELARLVAEQPVGTRPVVLRRLREPGPLTGVHILFIGKRERRVHEWIEVCTGPVLIVTEHEGAHGEGSVINLSTSPDRLQFSVSLAAAQARGLKLSARLLAVARNLRGLRP